MSMSRMRALLAAAVGAVLIAVLAPAAPVAAAPAPVPLVEDPASYVDPFVGTTRGGNTWPGATRPFGMIAWSPTNTARRPDRRARVERLRLQRDQAARLQPDARQRGRLQPRRGRRCADHAVRG
nr:hypothetical protein GCM10020092_091800 [Actinoplanes digitatis]